MLTRVLVDCVQVCILFAQEDPNCIQVFQNALLVPLTYLMITFTVKSNQKFLLRVNDTKRNRHVMHLSNIIYLRWLMSHAVSMHSFLSVVLFIVTAYSIIACCSWSYYKWQQQNTTTNTYRMYRHQQQQQQKQRRTDDDDRVASRTYNRVCTVI